MAGRGRGRGQFPDSINNGVPGRQNRGNRGGDRNTRAKPRGRGGGGGGRGQTNVVDGFWNTNSDSRSNVTPQESVWGPASTSQTEKPTPQGSNNGGTGNARFESACQQIQASLSKYLEAHPITDLSDEEEGEEVQDGVLARALAGVTEGGEASAAAEQHLRDALSSGALTCLICIHAVKSTDQTWSCCQCYSVLHLTCIQKWGGDSIYQRAEQERQLHDRDIRLDLTTFSWSCPKCRHQYPQSSIPRHYLCYCGKKCDPEFDPWLLPHSCGDKCGRALKPQCGHSCLLLCHPGPCAPCPVTVSVRCECGQSAPAPRRCSRKTWTCGRPCAKLLSCGQHRCATPCHTGPCQPCPRTSDQRCHCGAEKQTRPCNDPRWACDKVCGRPFPCGHHRCDRVCHPPTDCGDTCPQSADTRYCPCGKTPQEEGLPCHEAVPVCGDTCDKVLMCGQHRCTGRCHTGACGSCLEFCEKWCRCGSRAKKMACSKELTCDNKCRRLRDCRKHLCNKKCCVGDCPPCEQPCGKNLQCSNHKCSSRCHTGPCYPCNITNRVFCTCGGTSVVEPCGRERLRRLPRCSKQCKLRSKCRHPVQPPHKCHEGSCPSCSQVCQTRHNTCQHHCPSPCHDAVPVKVVDQRKRAGPWEPVAAPRLELRKMPCPPCKEPVVVLCRGAHDVQPWPCSESKHYSCGRECGRGLRCTNHVCERPCHYVDGLDPDNGDQLTKVEKRCSEKELLKLVVPKGAPARSNCRPCNRECQKVPVPGCSHLCKLPCHPGDCPPCQVKLKHKCHCGLLMVFKQCCDWTKLTEEAAKEKARSCGNQCFKLMRCGHTCHNTCHSGPCSDQALCDQRVPVKCACGRRRKEVMCREVTQQKSSGDVLKCDSVCQAKKADLLKAKEAEKERKAQQEEEENKRELEEFERRRAGRKSRGKRRVTETEEEEETVWQRYKIHVAIAVVILAVLMVVWRAAG